MKRSLKRTKRRTVPSIQKRILTSSKRTLVVANWKMMLKTEEAETLAQILVKARISSALDVVVCPSFTALAPVGSMVNGTRVLLGAQDVFWKPEGAYTGEISVSDLLSLGCRYVIIGHSERRRYLQETDEMIQRKVLASVSHGLSPILCVGETAGQRQENLQHQVVRRQLLEGLRNVPPARHGQEIVIAYEPVWAISPGGAADPQDAFEMARLIHQTLVDLYGERIVAMTTRTLYGGSVDAENIRSFVDHETIHGVLIGAQSIKGDIFRRIIQQLT